MRNRTGFTLIELMVTIAVAAVLLTLAAPSFMDTIRRNSATTQANELLAALHVARSEAVMRGREVAICPRASQASNSCGGATDWINGWVVRAVGDTDPLRIGDPLRPGTIFDAGEALITFEANGGARFASNANGDRILKFSLDEDEQTVRVVRINRLGRAVVDPH